MSQKLGRPLKAQIKLDTGLHRIGFVPGETEELACDTLVTAVGLIPERELALPLLRDGQPPDWLAFAGNCAHIHEIVDSVSEEAAALGAAAAQAIAQE